MTDFDAASFFPSMGSESSTTDTTAAAPADEQAIFKDAFPSMFKEAAPPAPERPAAPEQETTSTPPTSNTPPAEPVASRVEPAATKTTEPADVGEPTPIILGSTGVQVALPPGHVADEVALQELDGLAEDLRLDAAATQRLVDLHSATIERAFQANDKEVMAAWDRQSKAWHQELLNDPEVGGDNLVASASVAQRVLKTYAPEFKEDLKALGLGNHPGIFRLLVKVGKALGFTSSFDSTRGDASSAGRSDDEVARSAFPSMK